MNFGILTPSQSLLVTMLQSASGSLRIIPQVVSIRDEALNVLVSDYRKETMSRSPGCFGKLCNIKYDFLTRKLLFCLM